MTPEFAYHLVGIFRGVIALSADEYSGLDPGAGADSGSHTNVFSHFARNDNNPRQCSPNKLA